MNNKEIEKNIVQAFSKIDDGKQLESILSDCVKQERRMIVMEERNENRWLPRILTLATVFMLVVGIMFGTRQMNSFNEIVAATISLDVNPSIDIKINREEKVIDVLALNKDAQKIVGDMDFKGSNLDVTVNALIGSLVRNGYINDITNSILISVEDNDELAAKNLETKLMEEISNLLNKGSVLSQQVKTDEEVKKISNDYGITLGKAQMIKELADRSTIYSYEDLAGLTINELNLLSKNLDDSSLQRNGQPSDKAYIGVGKAKQIAFENLGVVEANVKGLDVELDFDNRRMVYEVEFSVDGVEYQYIIDALDGEIIFIDRDNIRTDSSNQTVPNNTGTNTNTNTNNSGTAATDLIGEAKAKQIAYNHAGVAESSVSSYHVKREYDDGVVKYEIEFYVGNTEYDYDINAKTGTIIKFESEVDDDYRPVSANASSPSNSQASQSSGDTYKVENGVVYEYDDGRWEAENDKKIENGVVYEYDDGKWQADKKTEGNITYDYDDDTGTWEADEKVENGVRYEYDDDTGTWEVDDDD